MDRAVSTGTTSVKVNSETWPISEAHKTLLETPGLVKIAHNWPFDGPRLMREGIALAPPLWDTLLAAQVEDCDSPGFSLDEVASYCCDTFRWKHKGAPGLKPKKKKPKTWKRPFTCAECGNDENLSGYGVKDERICVGCGRLDFELEMARWKADEVQYNRTDASILPEIYHHQLRALHASNQLKVFTNMMNVLYHVLIPLQIRGVGVDAGARKEAAEKFDAEIAGELATWSDLTQGVNPASVPQLKKLLYETLGLPPQYKKEKVDGEVVMKLTTDGEALHTLEKFAEGKPAQILRTLSALRTAQKWKRTYLEIGDRVFPNYSPASKDTAEKIKKFSAIAATGRIIAKGGSNPDGTKCPPLQQIPEELRNIIVPDPGMIFVGADYDSQELRLIAYKSNCTTLISQITSNTDIHSINSTNYGCDRTRAKNLFYGTVYGASPGALQHALKVEGIDITKEEAAGFISYMRKTYPEIFAWHEKMREFARANGYVENSWGRKRWIRSVDRMYNEILNYPIQSDGAEIQWNILIPSDKLAQEYGGCISILLHDGFYWQVPEALASVFIPKLRGILEQRWPQVHPDFWCPVTIKSGPNWRDLN